MPSIQSGMFSICFSPLLPQKLAQMIIGQSCIQGWPNQSEVKSKAVPQQSFRLSEWSLVYCLFLYFRKVCPKILILGSKTTQHNQQVNFQLE